MLMPRVMLMLINVDTNADVDHDGDVGTDADVADDVDVNVVVGC